MNLILSPSPHISSSTTTRRIMIDVLIALVPVIAAATFFFGWLVLANTIICVVFCMLLELTYTLFMSKKWSLEGIKKSSAFDLSSAVTGVILALNLPTLIKVWGLGYLDTVICCLLGSLVAIILVKMLFGGIGRNCANPALTARIFLFLAVGLGFIQTVGLGLDASSGATWLSSDRSVASNTIFNMFIGNTGSAAVGETSVIALLIGYGYLVFRRIIDWKMPLIIVASAGVFALLFDGLIVSQLSGTALVDNVAAHVVSGGLVFGAVFMATDYATSPNTSVGKIIYAVGIGLITILIRVWGGYPEGVSFAIVIMNIASPLIDKLTVPKPFGYTRTRKEVASK